ncbi:MAG: CCA tRNA nucleotidyltransferase [Phycisphaerales bacterium]|nr:CCA tRNA nucleotidyltransferase [Phycisphaerales bacterium]
MKSAQHDAWDAALFVIHALREAGHAALLAGGCVRDRLLGRTPKDYDVATDARPQRVREIFPRARLVGAKFGVVLVRKFGHNIEVATFRADGRYSDGRHPDEVTFGTELDDARRRDFTINGLFLDPAVDRLIDHVGGRDDLESRTIRTIGNPEQRFAEDHLRMLRAVRLAARLDFRIEAATADAIRRLAPNLSAISPERIWMELEQILTEPTRTAGWSLLLTLGLRAHLSSSWPTNAARDALVGQRLASLPDQAVDAPLALAAALTDLSPPGAREVCRSFRLSNRITNRTKWLLRSLPAIYNAAALELADFKTLLANQDWTPLLELLGADLAARGHDPGPVVEARRRATAIAPEDVAPPPLLSGDDLATLGVSPGPIMGEVLGGLYRAQLNEEVKTLNDALRFVKARLGEV